VINSGHDWPMRRITVGLSPASLPKRGSGFDVGIAVALLCADGMLREDGLAETVFLGELGLDGRIRAVSGCCRPSPLLLLPDSAGLSCRWRTPRRQL
jgi:magnesium chelatase family protein